MQTKIKFVATQNWKTRSSSEHRALEICLHFACGHSSDKENNGEMNLCRMWGERQRRAERKKHIQHYFHHRKKKHLNYLFLISTEIGLLYAHRKSITAKNNDNRKLYFCFKKEKHWHFSKLPFYAMLCAIENVLKESRDPDNATKSNTTHLHTHKTITNARIAYTLWHIALFSRRSSISFGHDGISEARVIIRTHIQYQRRKSGTHTFFYVFHKHNF